jgi:FixJ family two-component response regulator
MAEEPDSIVFIVDDDASFRDSLESLLRSVGQVSTSYPSARAFLEAAPPDLPACLVLDVRLPEQSGLELQRALAEQEVRLPVIVITGHGDIPMSVAAMKAGAIDFLTKPFRDQDLLDAIQRGVRLNRERRAEAVQLAALRQRHATLTSREREIMAMVAEGLPNKQIAAALGLREVTVKVHRAQVMRKLGAKSLPELARISDRLNAIPSARAD